MSRTGGSRPEYRLRFGYPYITVERVGAPPRRIPIDAADPQEALRAFGAEIARVGGLLKAVLPASEVWRGFIPAQQAAEAALRTAAEALRAPAEEIELALGPVGSDGRQPAAAARQETIAEARAFLERAGLPHAEITATPNLPGFGERPTPSAPLARPRPARKPGAPAMAASGLAAMVALTLWVGPWGPEAPAPEKAATPPTAAPAVAALPPPSVAAEAPPAPARPASEPVLKSAALAPPPAARPAPQMAPIALAARNLPDDLRPPRPLELAVRAAAEAAVAVGFAPRPRPVALEAPLAAAPAGPAPSMGPRARPPARVATAAMTTSTAALDAAILEMRPLARPAVAPVAVLAASLEAAMPAEDPTGPAARGPLARPRVAPAAPVRVATLNPSAATIAALAAEASQAATPPAPRAPAPAPAFVRAQAPKAEPAARPQPQPSPQAQQQARRRAVAAVEPTRVRTLAAQPHRVQPAAQVLRAKPAPEPAAQAARLRQPRRERAFGRQPRLGRDDLALIGIFGGANGRHALVQLSSGETERVRSGDDIQGVQVTAIAADAVHLRADGRDTVLKLPN